MKKALSSLMICAFAYLYSQVGIGTNNPNGALDVVGKTLVDSYIVDNVSHPASGKLFLLVRSKDSNPVGKVKILDVSERSVGPVNKYKIKISNVQKDKVYQLITGLPVDKYVVAVSGAVFSGASSYWNNDKTFGAYSTEVVTVNHNGTDYHALNLDFMGGSTYSNENGVWEIDLNVFEKALVKDWGTYSGSVGSNYSGTSTNTPDGLK
ncbi:hypothetical protein [Daejeonia sp. YH14]|uniref:hypothetical protein n=1 Tax=Daejeonia sp. YH14 TaxID=3439042 RepID=UPI003F493312